MLRVSEASGLPVTQPRPRGSIGGNTRVSG